MATVQKSTKINFYKFVQTKEVTSSPSGKISGGEIATVKAINTNTAAINNLGATVNSLAKIMSDYKKVAIMSYESELKNTKKFQAQYTTPKKREAVASGGGGGLSLKTPGFLDGLLNILGGLFKAAVVIPALEWISDPNNQK